MGGAVTDNLPVLRYRGELLPYPVRDHKPWELALAFRELFRRITPVFEQLNRAMVRIFEGIKATLAPLARNLQLIAEAVNETRGDEESWESTDAMRWSAEAGDALIEEVTGLGSS